MGWHEGGASRGTPAPIGLLTGRRRDYAWGSHTALAGLEGRAHPTPGPEAELWFGAHPSAPSLLERPGSPGTTPLDVAVAADPDGELGADVAATHGPRLPFLLKVLAADQPLSLQTHPSAAQARAGCAAEDAAGIARDAPQRNYRDDRAKPELMHALTDVDALCGFRDVAASVGLLDRLDVLGDVRERLRRHGERAMPDVVRQLLTWPHDDRRSLVAEVAAAAQRLADRPAARGGDDHDVEVARWAARLAQRYPTDPGVALVLLLEVVHLAPGESMHLPAGNLHAYLRGVGVEVMAASDNVLRGGLTAKHVDVDGFLDVLDPRAQPTPRVAPVRGGPSEVVFPAPADAFRLSKLDLDAVPVALDPRGPQVLLCTHGGLVAGADGIEVQVPPGRAAYVSARARAVTLAAAGPGRAIAFRATVGDARWTDRA